MPDATATPVFAAAGGNTNPAKDVDNTPDLAHAFVGAATISLTESRARRAAKYQSFRAVADERVDVLDVWCSRCRKNIEDLERGSVCAAMVDNTHLIGGDQAHRARRKPMPNLPAGSTLMPGPRVRRRGLDAYINREV